MCVCVCVYVYIHTVGYGHGVGMSQYGALGMAKEGYSYKDILSHYYQNTTIKKYNNVELILTGQNASVLARLTSMFPGAVTAHEE